MSAIDDGVAAFSKLNELGFVEFTTGLIEGVYDTLVESQMKQLKGYSELVKSLSGDVANFALDTVGLTISTANDSANDGGGDDNKPVLLSYLSSYFGVPVTAGGTTKVGDNLLPLALALVPDADPAPTKETALNNDTFKKAAYNKLKGEITNQYDLLVELVRIGFARLDTTGGYIETGLDFRISAAELDEVKSAAADIRTDSWHVNASVKAGFKKWGFQANGGYASNRIRVNTTNTTQTSSINMDARATARVRIDFKTTTFDTSMAKINASGN